MAHVYDGLAEFITNLPGDLPRQVVDELCRGWRIDQYLAEERQRQIAAAQPEKCTIDGLGQTVLSITPDSFHFWGQKLGYQCWKNKQFRREFARDNPDARVRTVPRKTCLRVNGFKT